MTKETVRHFELLREESKDELDDNEVEVTIKTSYCPTMILLNLPDTVSESIDSSIDNRSSGITMKYLKRKEAKLVILCESGMGDVAGSIWRQNSIL